MHRDPLPHVKGWETLGSVLTHVPETEEGNAKLNAKMWLVSRDLGDDTGDADSVKWPDFPTRQGEEDIPASGYLLRSSRFEQLEQARECSYHSLAVSLRSHFSPH